MNKLLFAFATCVCTLSMQVSAQWISETDKKYQSRNPALYSQVSKAQKLISEANGRTEKTREAVDLLQAVLAKDPKFAPAYVQFSRAISNLGYLHSNKFDGEALQSQEDFVKKALRLEPNYDYALAMMGYTLMFQGKLDEAEKYYKRAQALGTRYPHLKMQLSELAIKRGDVQKAFDYANEGYAENKADPKMAASSITQLLRVYEKFTAQEFASMEKWQSLRRTLDPDVAWYWGDHMRFRLYFIGDYENAIKYGEKALSLMDYRVGRSNLASSYYMKWAKLKDVKGQSAAASAAWKRAAALSPVTDEIIDDMEWNPTFQDVADALRAERKRRGKATTQKAM
jgi:tetratricopeptide (TPR) repeat protein